jgi:hypothetical protein
LGRSGYQRDFVFQTEHLLGRVGTGAGDFFYCGG